MESKKVGFFNKLSFASLLATFFLSVFFFVPYIPVTLEASKGFLISVGVTLSIFFWLVARLADGNFSIPKDRLILYGFLIPLIFLFASFFSASPYTSLFASGFEIGTFGSMLVLYLVFFLSATYFQTEKRLKYFFKALFAGALILGVFQVAYIFIGFDRILPGMFSGISNGNLIGTWNDLVLFFGMMVILSLFTLEFLKLNKKYRIALSAIIVIGLVFLMIINIPFVWVLVGAFSLIVFVYNVSLQHNNIKGEIPDRKIPVAALVVMIVSLLFLIGNNLIGGLISKYVNVYNPSLRPSVSATYHIAVNSLKHNPFFGTGPNTFDVDWALWKPSVIKDTPYWNAEFSQGIGLVPTFLVTTGILGFLSVVLFIVVFCLRGFQSLRIAFQSTNSNYLLMASFILAMYGWITMVIYTPNILLIMITFAASGAFLGSLVHKDVVRVYNLSFLNDPRHSFFSILGIVILMIGAVSTTYVYAQKFASIVYFSRSLNMPDSSIQSLVKSEQMILNAISLDKSDVYYRSLSQVYVAEVNALVSDKTISADTMKSRVQTIVTNIQQAAGAAVAQNPKQYQNWVNLGNVDASLVPLGVDKAYENAVSAYNQAQTLAPLNPSLLLSLAQLEFLHKDNDKAKSYIKQALEMKPDYIDAMFTLAQIDQSEGNLGDAIKQAELASTVSPNDSSVFFQLGILRYNNNDFSGAVSAFEQAVILNPSYMNARYFLGLSYEKVGRNDDAKIQFNILNKVLPDNADVKKELDKLNGVVSSTTVNTPSSSTSKTKKPTNKTTKLPLPEKN